MDALKLGGHLSISGGYTNALTKTIEIGGNSLQIFSSSPRNWGVSPVSNEAIEDFLKQKKQLHIDSVYFHASYLINLADDGRIGKASVTTLTNELKRASEMDVVGTIIHLGSFKKAEIKNYDQLLSNIQTVLNNTPENTFFIIENAGNNKICSTLDEMAFIIKSLNNKRVKVCLDTCHLYATGYDLSTPEKFDSYIKEFDQKIGLDKLELFQINDSKDPLGSYRDRHENLGEGTIPLEEFRLLLTDNRTKHLPMILEVPGENRQGPDQKNIQILKNLLT